jgi:hypothetical protein
MTPMIKPLTKKTNIPIIILCKVIGVLQNNEENIVPKTHVGNAHKKQPKISTNRILNFRKTSHTLMKSVSFNLAISNNFNFFKLFTAHSGIYFAKHSFADTRTSRGTA